MNNETSILRVLVGSRAHGLANPDSDFDYRGVFAVPTKDVLSLEGITNNTHWIEGKVDDTSWEIKHFLRLATKCNPTILECFLAPDVNPTKWSKRLQDLFPEIWNSKDVYNAFKGYGMNQRKKFLEDKDNRPWKYAAAYMRVLYNACELLSTGTFTIKISELSIGDDIRDTKKGFRSRGEVIDICHNLEIKLDNAYAENMGKSTNLEAANEFLLDIRKELW